MKRLLGLLLLMGMVGCGGDDEAPPAGEAALPATPNKPQAKVDEPPVQTVDTPPAGEAALPATPNNPQAKVDEVPVKAVDASKLVQKGGLTYERNSKTPFTGVRVGKYENGQKKKEATYKDGKLDGLFTGWHENGQKAQEVTYKDGKPEGLGIGWLENGQKWSEVTYKDGKQVSATYWDEEGNER